MQRFEGTSPEHARALNRRTILEALRLEGPLSRAGLARITSLSAQSVSNIAEELKRDGFLIEERRRTGERGQPPLELALNPDAGFTLGLSLNRDQLTLALVDLAGTRRVGVTRALRATASPDRILATVEAAVRDAVAQASILHRRVLGAGIVLPAVLEGGRPVAFGPTQLPALNGVPLTELLADRLGMPVIVENDATAAALGEQLYGLGKGLRNFVYIFIGLGLGAGLVLDGKPFRGTSAKAGELGHLIVVPGGLPCSCGNRGCLERYVSLEAASAALGAGGRPAEASELVRKLERGDSAIAGWLDESASHLRIAIATLENLLDPETVMIGGTMPEPLMDGLVRRLAVLLPSVSQTSPRHVPRVVRARIGFDIPALGAAALPLFHSLAPHLDLVRRRRPQRVGSERGLATSDT